MRMRGASLLVAAVLATPAAVRAQTPPPAAAQLQSAGELAAKQGNFDLAIDDFKQADAIEPRASHACLIALAYARRNLWTQAEIFSQTCHQRANAGDPVPTWMAAADKQIADGIARAGLVAVTLEVQPATAKITIAGLPDDEAFGPRTIHLAARTYDLLFRAPGYDDRHQLIEVKAGTPLRLAITLHAPGEATAAPALPTTAPPPTTTTAPAAPASTTALRATSEPAPAHASKTPWILGGAGLAAVATAGVLDAIWYRDQGNADDGTYYGRLGVIWGLGSLGAVAVGTAIYLGYAHHHAAGVAFVPTRGGGIVSVGWMK